jgi:hypothetical protein
MTRLTLRVDDLAVESFHTAPETRRGTVVAAEYTVILEQECQPDTFYDPACCSTHETACEGATCVVLSRCCPSNDPTCPASCQQTCRDCGGLSLGPCYPTEIC